MDNTELIQAVRDGSVTRAGFDATVDVALAQGRPAVEALVAEVLRLQAALEEGGRRVGELERDCRLLPHWKARAEALSKKLNAVRKDAVRYKRHVDYRMLREFEQNRRELERAARALADARGGTGG